MQACSTAHSVSVPTLDPKETVMNLSALMDALETALLKCVEGLGTSTSSTLMHTSQLLMTLDVETLPRTPTTKGGLKTWATATFQHHLLHLQEHQHHPMAVDQPDSSHPAQTVNIFRFVLV